MRAPVFFLACIAPVLGALAADIAVRREGPAFRISGGLKPADVAVYVGDGDVPPVLGAITADGPDLLFRPRFEIPRTLACRVVAGGREFRFPAEAQPVTPSTTVERIYPTAAEIPANQLKFYIQFSAPMRPGGAWQNLQLLDSRNRPVDLAFLEIDQELWDPEGRRLTVLFDPGRIKRGVLPRDQAGAALIEGESYTLVAARPWRDRSGAPLVSVFRKTFRVTAEDRTPIDPARWTISSPRAGTREPLVLSFGESLDAALASRLITLPSVPGSATLGPAERQWLFVPDNPWVPGARELFVDTALEDLAGNRVGRPFDVDTFERITTRATRDILRLPFRIE